MGLLPGHEFVEVPAQAVLDARALSHEVLAVIYEEADIALDTLEPGRRQIRLAQGRAGSRQRVDGVALAGFASRPT